MAILNVCFRIDVNPVQCKVCWQGLYTQSHDVQIMPTLVDKGEKLKFGTASVPGHL